MEVPADQSLRSGRQTIFEQSLHVRVLPLSSRSRLRRQELYGRSGIRSNHDKQFPHCDAFLENNAMLMPMPTALFRVSTRLCRDGSADKRRA